MNDLFMPKDQKKLTDLIDKDPIFGDSPVWVFTRGRSIWSTYDFKNEKLLAEREGTIFEFCLHEDKLYDCGEYGLLNTLTGEKFMDGRVDTICSHEPHLMFGMLKGFGGFKMFPDKHHTFYDETDVKIFSNINSMCSHDDKLVVSYRAGDGSDKSKVKIHGGDFLFDDLETVAYLGSFEGNLYATQGRTIFNAGNGNIIATRSNPVWGFVQRDGILYDFGISGVYSTFESKKIVGNSIGNCISVPGKILEGYL